MSIESTTTPEHFVGQGEFVFACAADWQELPHRWRLGEVTAVATDSQDRAFVLSRSARPVTAFDAEGRFLFGWGEGMFARPHGIFIGPDDYLYVTDDLDHTVRKFTAEGELLLTLGRSGCPSDTGALSVDYRNIRRTGPPFNFPTNLALASNGEMFVSDGYGNARIHRFDPAGRLLASWGEPGDAPGQFHVPHGIAVDRRNTVYVADRENSRIQLFTADGEFIDSWTDVARPCEVFVDAHDYVYVAELGYLAGMFPGNVAPSPRETGGRMSIFSRRGSLVARWGGGRRPTAPGDFFAPHDVWVDSRGNVYVSEVCYTAGKNAGNLGTKAHTLQRFNKTNRADGIGPKRVTSVEAAFTRA